MPRKNGHRLTAAVREQAIQALQGLIAAGVDERDARRQIETRYNVSARTTRDWLSQAYAGLADDVGVDRQQLIGVALGRRRLAMGRAARDGDWTTFLKAAESESRLLGLDAPKQTEHHVVVERMTDLTRLVVEVVRDFFADDPDTRARFVQALQERLSAALTRKVQPKMPVLDAEVADKTGDV